MSSLKKFVPRNDDKVQVLATHGDCLAVERMVDAKRAPAYDRTHLSAQCMKITCPFITGHVQQTVQRVEPGLPWHSCAAEERLRSSSRHSRRYELVQLQRKLSQVRVHSYVLDCLNELLKTLILIIN